MVLETPEERVRLLKAGIPGKRIEDMYIKFNSYTIVGTPLSLELVELTDTYNRK